MRYPRYILILAIIFVGAVNITAQQEEVKVVKPYNPTLSGAEKIQLLPDLEDTVDYTMPNFEYTLFPKQYNTGFRVTPIKPARMVKMPLDKLYKSELKAGIGNYLTPLVDLRVNQLRSSKGSFGVGLRHHSMNGKVKLANDVKVDAGFSENDLSIYGKRYSGHNVFEYKAGGSYNRSLVDAQEMYPHYFERFKTDGVEHSLYIGESITKQDSFHKIYLYNLRLWQLQAMCEMENKFYQLKETLPLALDVASMILVFGGSLSLRFRLDEKRFDVDGTYNARYEVVKKRVDKANIKGTDERITQAGKISIIYSQTEDEREYLKYIRFLQSKKQLGDNLEILDVQDLQGVTGLKAIRVNVLYNSGKEDKEYYTYEDLMKEIGS